MPVQYEAAWYSHETGVTKWFSDPIAVVMDWNRWRFPLMERTCLQNKAYVPFQMQAWGKGSPLELLRRICENHPPSSCGNPPWDPTKWHIFFHSTQQSWKPSAKGAFHKLQRLFHPRQTPEVEKRAHAFLRGVVGYVLVILSLYVTHHIANWCGIVNRVLD